MAHDSTLVRAAITLNPSHQQSNVFKRTFLLPFGQTWARFVMLFFPLLCGPCLLSKRFHPSVNATITDNGHWVRYRLCYPPFNWTVPLGMNKRATELFWKQPENWRHFKDTNASDHCGVVRVIENGIVRQPFPESISNVTHFINDEGAPRTTRYPSQEFRAILTGHWGNYFQHFFDNLGPQIVMLLEALGMEPQDVPVYINISSNFKNVPYLWDRLGFRKWLCYVKPTDVSAETLALVESALSARAFFQLANLGVPFPGINIRPNPNLPPMSYMLNLNEIPLARGVLVRDAVIVREKRETLDMLGIPVETGEKFLPDVESLWVPKSYEKKLAAAGISCMDHSKILAYHLSLLLSRHAENFIGMQETKYLLDRLEERMPDLVREATRLLPIQRIADIFQRLVQEHVSIRDLRTILQALIDWAPKEKDVVMLTEYVRSALKRQISYMHSRGQNMLPVIIMEPQVEEVIRKAVRQTSAGAFLSLDPGSSKRILDALEAALGRSRTSTQKPVLMVSMDIRRYVRRLIEAKFYEIPVMAYQEVTPEIAVQPIARIRI